MKAKHKVAGLLLPAMMLTLAVRPAAAVAPLPIVCTAAGTVTATDGGAVDAWVLAGKGSCQGAFDGTYAVEFVGTGKSFGLGICDGSLVVNNLNLTINGTLTSFRDGVARPFTDLWSAPVTTFPVATPFLVTSAAGYVGEGFFSNNVFLNCAGTPVAQFRWTHTTVPDPK